MKKMSLFCLISGSQGFERLCLVIVLLLMGFLCEVSSVPQEGRISDHQIGLVPSNCFSILTAPTVQTRQLDWPSALKKPHLRNYISAWVLVKIFKPNKGSWHKTWPHLDCWAFLPMGRGTKEWFIQAMNNIKLDDSYCRAEVMKTAQPSTHCLEWDPEHDRA